MKCPVCGKEIRFEDGVYCSSECAELAERELEQLLDRDLETDIEGLLETMEEFGEEDKNYE